MTLILPLLIATINFQPGTVTSYCLHEVGVDRYEDLQTAEDHTNYQLCLRKINHA